MSPFRQSSAWAQQLTAETWIEGNVFFNSPRAAINFNDGFAGGDTIIGNLLFGHCRETTEVGPMNSWHRAPYIYDHGLVDDNSTNEMPSLAEIAAGATPGYRAAPPGVGSVINKYRKLRHNFLIGNYNVYDTMETDDASSRYMTTSNYLLYGKVVINSAMLHGNWNYVRLYHITLLLPLIACFCARRAFDLSLSFIIVECWKYPRISTADRYWLGRRWSADVCLQRHYSDA